jgi:hypothetical protein
MMHEVQSEAGVVGKRERSLLNNIEGGNNRHEGSLGQGRVSGSGASIASSFSCDSERYCKLRCCDWNGTSRKCRCSGASIMLHC